MTIRRHLLVAGAALAALCASLAAPAVYAQNTPTTLNYLRAQSHVMQGFGNASAVPQTFSTTSYADLTGAQVTYNPMVDPNAAAAPGGAYPADWILVKWSADVSKATAGTGTCAVFVNGAVVAQTARAVASTGGEGEAGGVAVVKNSTTGSQTVKLQCKSSDANVFTVNNGTIVVDEIY